MAHRPLVFTWTAAALLAATVLSAQDRNTKVHKDREAFADSEDWIYNDLDQGLAQARKTGKPVLAVLRCIP